MEVISQILQLSLFEYLKYFFQFSLTFLKAHLHQDLEIMVGLVMKKKKNESINGSDLNLDDILSKKKG